MSKERRSTSLIPATEFRVLTCRICEEDDRAVFTDSPPIGWLQSKASDCHPVDPIILDGNAVLGSELATYQTSYQVFPAEWHEGLRWQLKRRLEAEARHIEAQSLKKTKVS